MALFCTPLENEILTRYLDGTRNPEVRLHSADPGEDGTANRVLQSDAVTPVVAKGVTFGANQNRTGGGRERPSDVAVSWSGTELPSGSTVAWITIWSNDDAATPALTARWRLQLTEAKTTGSDGIEFAIGSIVPGAN